MTTKIRSEESAREMEKTKRELKEATNVLKFQMTMLLVCCVGTPTLAFLPINPYPAALTLLLVTSGLASAPKTILAGVAKLKEGFKRD